MKAIIMAAGEQTRWGNSFGVPKHLIPVNHEPIVKRTIRLLRDQSVVDISLVGPDSDLYRIQGSKLHVPKKTPAYADADKFLSSQELWNTTGRTITLFGDVYFTEQAIRVIVNDTDTNWKVYGRPTPSNITGKKCAEIFAHSFYPADIDRHRQMLFYIIELYNQGKINDCRGWEHYRAMHGARGAEVDKHEIYGNFTVIDDWTEDFDKAKHYIRFCQRWEEFHNPGVPFDLKNHVRALF
jgi:hypothetical protein